jgi:hypothetical protein
VTESGHYLYAVARGVDEGDLADTTGLRDEPVHVLGHRGLSAVLSTVDLDEFGEEGLRRNLEDLAWLEQVARGHDRVVKAVSEVGATAPMRLATIFRDTDAVRARLDEWYDALQVALDRVQGRMEWSVKAFAPATVPAAREAAAVPSSGTDYLRRKKDETLQRHKAEEQALQVADTVHETLSRHSVASRRLRPQDPRLSKHEGTMTLNGAYLVESAGTEAFDEAAAALVREYPEAHIEVYGPWPPYSFATLEQQ